MMKEENITLEKGSGKENRITKADVIEAKEETPPLEENKSKKLQMRLDKLESQTKSESQRHH